MTSNDNTSVWESVDLGIDRGEVTGHNLSQAFALAVLLEHHLVFCSVIMDEPVHHNGSYTAAGPQLIELVTVLVIP